MAIHGGLSQYNEIQGSECHSTLQNSKMLKVGLRRGPFEARSGSMVAYQGEAAFEDKASGGIGKILKKATTGKAVDLMHVGGTGGVFIADTAQDIVVFYLKNDQVSVNGKNILAFSSSVQWDIQRIGGGMAGIVAGGLYNVVLQGTGSIAINTDGVL